MAVPPLLRLVLIRLGGLAGSGWWSRCTTWCWTAGHCPILFQELSEVYAAGGDAGRTAPGDASYRDYLAWLEPAGPGHRTRGMGRRPGRGHGAEPGRRPSDRGTRNPYLPQYVVSTRIGQEQAEAGCVRSRGRTD
ncbi:hypothetical protein SFUMM280S_07637 [Streptomyces fumanus]